MPVMRSAIGRWRPTPWGSKRPHSFDRPRFHIFPSGPASIFFRDPCFPAVGGAVASAAMWCAYRLLVMAWATGHGAGRYLAGSRLGRGGLRRAGGVILGLSCFFAAGTGMGTGAGVGDLGAGVTTLCSGAAGVVVSCFGGAVARLRICAIWMYAFVTLDP